MFTKKVRTNNHLEGGRRHLNTKTDTGNIPIYPLIYLLHEESNAVERNCNLLQEGQLNTYITAKYATTNREFFELWANFDEGKITVKQLLHACAKVKAYIKHIKKVSFISTVILNFCLFHCFVFIIFSSTSFFAQFYLF